MSRLSRPLIQLTRTRLTHAGSEECRAAAQQLQSQRHLRLPGFFAADLLASVRSRLRHAPFVTRVAQRVFPPAVDLKLQDTPLQASLRWLLADPALCAVMTRLAGSEPLVGFAGAVYRMEDGAGHRDSWHNDVDGRRRLGITVNLSEGEFAGGELQMRRQNDQQPLWTLANTGEGDALLFAIDETLEHCIRPVRGAVAKTALAGWFLRA